MSRLFSYTYLQYLLIFSGGVRMIFKDKQGNFILYEEINKKNIYSTHQFLFKEMFYTEIVPNTIFVIN